MKTKVLWKKRKVKLDLQVLQSTRHQLNKIHCKDHDMMIIFLVFD